MRREFEIRNEDEEGFLTMAHAGGLRARLEACDVREFALLWRAEDRGEWDEGVVFGLRKMRAF